MADHASREGKSYAAPQVLEYVERVHAAHDSGLARAFGAPEALGLPAIQVGASEGKLLQLLLRLAGARKVVEVGTLAGYSALCMARALPAGGRLWTIESDPDHHRIATTNVEHAGLSAVVTCMLSSGLDALLQLEPHGPFDALFVDADKASYDRYGDWAARNLRRGGLLLGDNAFLFGRLLDDSPEAQAMRRFHEQAAVEFDTACIPTPDGLLLGIKR